jgi:hypothetical protein
MTFPFLKRGPMPRHYGKPKGWKGPVERRDPRHYQRQGDVGIVKCVNRWCLLWLVSGTARCPHCRERQG